MNVPWKSVVLAAMAVVCFGAVAEAQPGRRAPGGGFGQRGGFGISLLNLVQNEAVAKEIEILDDQAAEIKKLVEELRGDRGERGDRPDFRNMSEQEREKLFADMRQRREKQTKEANGKLAEILLKPQMERAEEIRIQALGLAALSDPEVAKKLKITDAQKKKMEEANTASRESMRARFQQLAQGGGERDRDAIREEFQKLRKEAEKKVLAVLDSPQKAEFEKIKGEPFEMPEGGFGQRRPDSRQGPDAGPGRGRPGGQGGQGRGPRPASE